MIALIKSQWKRVKAALKYDYVSGHRISVHPGRTVLLGRRAAGVQNGRIHLSSEGDVTNRKTVPGVSRLLTFVATGRIWPDLSRHRVGVWDRLSLLFEIFLQRFNERVKTEYDAFISVLSVCRLRIRRRCGLYLSWGASCHTAV